MSSRARNTRPRSSDDAVTESEQLSSPQVIWQAAGVLAHLLDEAGDDAGAEAAVK